MGGAGGGGGATQGHGGEAVAGAPASPAAGAAGQGGAPVNCVEVIFCEEECPFRFWDDLQGCPTCACAPPPLTMQTNGVVHDPAHVAMEASAAWSPGSGRLTFSFRWTYDDPTMEDEEQFVSAAVDMPEGLVWHAPVVTTFQLPSDDPQLSCWANWTSSGLLDQRESLTIADGYFSVRNVDGDYEVEGGIYLSMESTSAYPGTVVVGGPFAVQAL